MYLRTVKTPGPGNTVYEYIRLVEAYREDGKSKQRVVANLGRKDLLAPHAEALLRVLTGAPAPEGYVPEQAVQPLRVWRWGAMLIALILCKNSAWTASWTAWRALPRLTLRPWRIVPWCWWLIGSPPLAANTAWPAFWSPTTSATGRDDNGSPAGATMASGWPAVRHGSASIAGNSSSGTAPWTS